MPGLDAMNTKPLIKSKPFSDQEDLPRDKHFVELFKRTSKIPQSLSRVHNFVYIPKLLLFGLESRRVANNKPTLVREKGKGQNRSCGNNNNGNL